MLVNTTLAASDKSLWYFSYDRLTTAWSNQGDFFLTNYSYAAVVATFSGNAFSLSCVRDLTGSADIMVSVDDIPEGPFSTTASSDAEVGPGVVFSKTGLDPALKHEVIVHKIPDPTVTSPVSNLKIQSFTVTSDNTVRATAAASNYVPKGPNDVIIDDTHAFLRHASVWKSSIAWGVYGANNNTLLTTQDPNQSVNLTFQGTAVEVVSLPWWDGGNFTVTLDGVKSNPISLWTNDVAKLKPTVVFSADSLDSSKAHLLSIVGLPDDPNFIPRISTKGFLNVDSFIISNGKVLDPDNLPPGTTFADGKSSANGSGSISAGAIAGIVIGVLASLAALAFLFFFLRRRRQNRPSAPAIVGKAQPSSRVDFTVTPYRDEALLSPDGSPKMGQDMDRAARQPLLPSDPNSITPFVVPHDTPNTRSEKTGKLGQNYAQHSSGSGSNSSTRPTEVAAIAGVSPPASSGRPTAASHRPTGSFTSAATSSGVNDQIEELRRELYELRTRQNLVEQEHSPPVYQ